MNQQRPSTSSFNQFKPGPGIVPNEGIYGIQPPPLPPRPLINNNFQYYGSYRPNYMSTYGGYNTLGRYGSYGGYNSYPYGPSGDIENRFVQFAEESSRPAFQSIESIVNTFSSITMMLESTFFAMSSSFRAILSVAENVSRVRSMFGQLLSTFALIKFFKWLYKKIIYQFGFSANDPVDEKLWKKTILEVVNGEKTGPSTWPILIFLGLLVIIPYVMHKLVKNVQQQQQSENDPREWFKLNEPVYSATAGYDFLARSPEELSLKARQKIFLAPQSLQPKKLSGWSQATDGVNVGLVPTNYITIVGQLKKKPNVVLSECFDNDIQ